MADFVGNIVNLIFFLIGIIIVFGIAFRVFKDSFLKEKELDAVIINKQCYDKRVYSIGQAPYTKKNYIVSFLCGKKKLHFEVSEFSYKIYSLNQKGRLRYKGNRLIDFGR